MKHKQITFLLLLILSTFNQSKILTNNTPKLLIKLATRSRSKKFFKILDLYYKKLSNQVPYHFLISCDIDDPDMNRSSVKDKLSTYPNLSFYYSQSKNKIDAINRDIEKYLDFDILLVASDDMTPIANGYDQIIVSKMLEHFPDLDGTLNIFDGHCKAELNTIPIMGKKYYSRFGYVYHPDYESICCDLEFTLVARMLNKEAIFNKLMIRHDHPSFGFPSDTLYRKNESKKFFEHDKAILHKRKATNFDLKYKDIETQKLPTSLDLYGAYNPNKIKWSILICTLDERESQFVPLYKKLLNQIEKNGLQHVVEIVFFKDNRNFSTGHKRNVLLQNSLGQYVNFIDDDDDIHPNYIQMIYEKLLSNPDCVSLVGILTVNDKNPEKFIHTIKYDTYFKRNGTYYRPPNHLNPIKRSIAIQFPFPNKTFSEDTDWAMQIAGSKLLKREEKINIPYYFYLCRTKKTAPPKNKQPLRTKANRQKIKPKKWSVSKPVRAYKNRKKR